MLEKEIKKLRYFCCCFFFFCPNLDNNLCSSLKIMYAIVTKIKLLYKKEKKNSHWKWWLRIAWFRSMWITLKMKDYMILRAALLIFWNEGLDYENANMLITTFWSSSRSSKSWNKLTIKFDFTNKHINRKYTFSFTEKYFLSTWIIFHHEHFINKI